MLITVVAALVAVAAVQWGQSDRMAQTKAPAHGAPRHSNTLPAMLATQFAHAQVGPPSSQRDRATDTTNGS